jgi:hypothetical protein
MAIRHATVVWGMDPRTSAASFQGDEPGATKWARLNEGEMNLYESVWSGSVGCTSAKNALVNAVVGAGLIIEGAGWSSVEILQAQTAFQALCHDMVRDLHTYGFCVVMIDHETRLPSVISPRHLAVWHRYHGSKSQYVLQYPNDTSNTALNSVAVFEMNPPDKEGRLDSPLRPLLRMAFHVNTLMSASAQAALRMADPPMFLESTAETNPSADLVTNTVDTGAIGDHTVVNQGAVATQAALENQRARAMDHQRQNDMLRFRGGMLGAGATRLDPVTRTVVFDPDMSHNIVVLPAGNAVRAGPMAVQPAGLVDADAKMNEAIAAIMGVPLAMIMGTASSGSTTTVTGMALGFVDRRIAFRGEWMHLCQILVVGCADGASLIYLTRYEEKADGDSEPARVDGMSDEPGKHKGKRDRDHGLELLGLDPDMAIRNPPGMYFVGDGVGGFKRAGERAARPQLGALRGLANYLGDAVEAFSRKRLERIRSNRGMAILASRDRPTRKKKRTKSKDDESESDTDDDEDGAKKRKQKRKRAKDSDDDEDSEGSSEDDDDEKDKTKKKKQRGKPSKKASDSDSENSDGSSDEDDDKKKKKTEKKRGDSDDEDSEGSSDEDEDKKKTKKVPRGSSDKKKKESKRPKGKDDSDDDKSGSESEGPARPKKSAKKRKQPSKEKSDADKGKSSDAKEPAKKKSKSDNDESKDAGADKKGADKKDAPDKGESGGEKKQADAKGEKTERDDRPSPEEALKTAVALKEVTTVEQTAAQRATAQRKRIKELTNAARLEADLRRELVRVKRKISEEEQRAAVGDMRAPSSDEALPATGLRRGKGGRRGPLTIQLGQVLNYEQAEQLVKDGRMKFWQSQEYVSLAYGIPIESLSIERLDPVRQIPALDVMDAEKQESTMSGVARTAATFAQTGVASSGKGGGGDKDGAFGQLPSARQPDLEAQRPSLSSSLFKKPPTK